MDEDFGPVGAIEMRGEEGETKAAHEYASRTGEPVLGDYLVLREQKLDLDKEEKLKGNLNYFDGYYVETE